MADDVNLDRPDYSDETLQATVEALDDFDTRMPFSLSEYGVRIHALASAVEELIARRKLAGVAGVDPPKER